MDTFDWNSLVPAEEHGQRVDVRSVLEGRTVLITGAGGYIGSALAHACARLGAAHLVLLDLAEPALYSVDQALRAMDAPPRITPLLGSAGDPALVHAIFSQHMPRIVFHAGAYKHVPLAEANPFAVLHNNALATAVLADVCAQYRDAQLIMVSTDKSVAPAGIMGASKRLGELAVLGRTPGTVQRAVRLGNVLGSPGSVGPLFAAQANAGQPLTVTHPDAVRYFVSLQRTTAFLLAACAAPPEATLLIPRLDAPVRVADLARQLAGARDYAVAYTGLRPGEKLAEALLGPDEEIIGAAPGRLQIVRSPQPAAAQLERCLAEVSTACEQRDMQRLLAALRIVIPGFRQAEDREPQRMHA